MEYLSWDLSVLSRAVAYSNLSGASSNIGLSQPQLSRIIAKLEEQTDLVLLNRETKRKSSWTPAALQLAEIYTNTFQKFRSDVTGLVDGSHPDHLRLGVLEGVSAIAISFCERLFEKTGIKTIELNVFDTSVLEEKFFKNEVDLIYCCNEPGRKKFSFQKLLGYQTIDPVKKGGGEIKVFSSFEYATQMAIHKKAKKHRSFVSNSLKVRRTWLEEVGGTGALPSKLKSKKSGKKNEIPLYVIAQENTSPSFWKEISKLL